MKQNVWSLNTMNNACGPPQEVVQDKGSHVGRADLNDYSLYIHWAQRMWRPAVENSVPAGEIVSW